MVRSKCQSAGSPTMRVYEPCNGSAPSTRNIHPWLAVQMAKCGRRKTTGEKLSSWNFNMPLGFQRSEIFRVFCRCFSGCKPPNTQPLGQVKFYVKRPRDFHQLHWSCVEPPLESTQKDGREILDAWTVFSLNLWECFPSRLQRFESKHGSKHKVTPDSALCDEIGHFLFWPKNNRNPSFHRRPKVLLESHLIQVKSTESTSKRCRSSVVIILQRWIFERYWVR